jgi:thiol-disulfide isomerase/thioredoxin
LEIFGFAFLIYVKHTILVFRYQTQIIAIFSQYLPKPMKYTLNFLLFFFIQNISFAQKTTIHGKLPSMKGASVTIGRPTKWLVYDTPKTGFIETQIAQNGEFSLDLSAVEKEIIFLSIWDNLADKRLFFEYLYVSKGENLLVLEDFDKEVRISGKHNQLKGISNEHYITSMEQDSLPSRILTIINGFYENDKKIIETINSSEPTSSDFKEAWSYHLKYAQLATFYYNYGNKRLGNPAVNRNNDSWLSVINKLQKDAPICDDNALVAPSYHEFLRTFLMRKHDIVREDFYERPTLFYKEWFAGDSLKAKAVMEIDYTNQLKQKIIERYFTGKVKEYLYALLFDSMIQEQHFFNAKSVFSDFERQYPNSQYIKYFKKSIQEATARLENTISKKAVFLEGSTTAKWDNILEHFKGKTVFLDMWGTWCSPCRQEIEKNAAALKKHFEDKGVEFLYITNYDKSETKWKQLIAFYNLEGSHVFANEALTDEIMKKIKGSGYPSYAIIDKNGNIAKVEYPIDREILIQQIEETLKK